MEFVVIVLPAPGEPLIITTLHNNFLLLIKLNIFSSISSASFSLNLKLVGSITPSNIFFA